MPSQEDDSTNAPDVLALFIHLEEGTQPIFSYVMKSFACSHVTLSSIQSYWENGMELRHHHFYTDELPTITFDGISEVN